MGLGTEEHSSNNNNILQMIKAVRMCKSVNWKVFKGHTGLVLKDVILQYMEHDDSSFLHNRFGGPFREGDAARHRLTLYGVALYCESCQGKVRHYTLTTLPLLEPPPVRILLSRYLLTHGQ